MKGSRKHRDRQKVRPSQGDAVLVGIMGGQNRPDIAKTAGEEPLQDDSDEEMVVRDVGGAAVDNVLVQTAQDAARIIDGADRNTEDLNADSHNNRSSVDLCGCITQALKAKEEDPRKPELVAIKEETETVGESIIVTSKVPATAAEKALNAKTSSPKTRRSSSSRGNIAKGRRNSDSLASSPIFVHAISVSHGSPMDSETLPAMKSSPQQNASTSPNGQQSLPSIHDQLGSLADIPVIGEAANGTSTNGRPGFAPINGVSPPQSTQFPNLQTRPFHPYPPTQPSPSSASYSSNSPHDYRPGHDATGMSPPVKPGPGSAYYCNGQTSQSDEQGPLSAESNPTTGSYSTDASPNGDRMSIDGPGPITLPPLPAGGPLPLATGGFKCEYAGCTAAPFQTQYLLK